jgi:hypothetical protein
MTAWRFLSPLLLCLGLALAMSLASCPSAPMEDRTDPVLWHLPRGQGRVPLVLVLEETSLAGWSGRSPWIDWFLGQGIAVAQIRHHDQAGRQDWLDGGCSIRPAMAAPEVLALAQREQPRIDTAQFAVMGAGRRGTEALASATAFAAGDTLPTAVFAFYPGCAGQCPLAYAADGPTQVHIFYGGRDDWGLQRGGYHRCRQHAGGQISFHEFAEVGHGFDESRRFTETTGRIILRHQPDTLTTEIARSIVLATLTLAWQIDN